MNVLSVVIGSPSENSANWIRIKKQMEILTNLGHDVELCLYTRKNLDFKPPFNFSMIKVSPFTIFFKHLFKILRDKYDFIFCNLHPAPFICLLSKFKSIPMILDNHGDLVSETDLLYNPNIFKKFYYRIISFIDLKISDRIICVSNSMINDLIKKGVPKDKLYYVTNGVDTHIFRPLDQKNIKKVKNDLGLNNKLVFGYVGSCDKWQGLGNLIKAAEMNSDKDVFFLFVGFSNRKRKTHNALFLPRVPQEEIKYYYGACDVLVLPRPYHKSTQVAAPTKFAEYAAMGKPILATNVGDAASFVKKYNCGIVVDDNSPRNLILGIKKFKSLPRKELLKMGENSRKMAEKEFSMEKMKQDLKKVIESLF